MLVVLQLEVKPHDKLHFLESFSDDQEIQIHLSLIASKKSIFKVQKHYESMYDGQNVFRLIGLSQEPLYIELVNSANHEIHFSQGNDLHPKRLILDQPDVSSSSKYKMCFYTADHGPIVEFSLKKDDYGFDKIVIIDSKNKNRSYVYEF